VTASAANNDDFFRTLRSMAMMRSERLKQGL